ncbi:hypothetical protein N7448_005986 [Penicillium atrosanguineum]|uniref:uncharacterized protein n=1 Tax=Penicillium atrosanguineum TaxID=1132637 RepID=UPI00239B4803|nr:uncharacterized protein N7443_009748 [Penicillium atrosanguineum]KAJ5131828.1 hypothetical protein N7448_005986 [Penicillium atrosanguineum]KAJ5289495.1 hypothetical protein N7443_009748 [Penicillium atrosanguineum]
MSDEEAPPPYSATDPLNAANNRNGNSSRPIPLRDNAQAQEAGSSGLPEPGPSTPSVVPTHFFSAVTYFEQRPPTVIDDSRGLLDHHMTIYPRSQAKDFPRRPRCWNDQFGEVIQQDWDTFLRYLFPAQLGLAAASQHLPRQLRAEIQRDRKDRPQETDEQRHARITAVVDEWNQCFFEPRATRIVFVYVGEPDAAPTSALCPRCYPAATKATQGTGTPTSMESQAPAIANAPSPVGQPSPSPTSWHMPQYSPFGTPQHMPYGTPYGVPPFTAHATQNGQPSQYYTPPPPGAAPWQWQPWGYTPPQFGPSGTSKSGPLGWISNITSQAQKYGERFAEQAQHYGDQISSQAMQYGRQVEEQAMAHGWWIEDQARLHGRKPNVYPSGYPPGYPPAACNGGPPWSPAPAGQTGQIGGVAHNRPTSTLTSTSTPTSPTTTTTPVNTTENRPSPQPQPEAQPKPQIQSDHKSLSRSFQRSRRASTSSVSSVSSLSSIDSLSTTSDLDASDLANIRTQLQSLHDRHDRTLYEAAVDLRRQLSLLEESRREARTSGRRNWRNGPQGPQTDSTDWGRWESPEQQQREATERRAMKEEMRATKKAFRDVIRRARDEQRDKRRARKNRLRHTRAQPQPESKPQDEILLDGRMAALAVEEPTFRPPARSHTEPISQAHRPQPAPLRSDASSEVSVPGAIKTPLSASMINAHGSPAGVPDKKSKLKQMLKSRNIKKQQKAEKETEQDKSKKDGK